MKSTRREILKKGMGAAAMAALVSTETAGSGPQTTEGKRRRIPLAVSTYSYWHFKRVKFPIEQVIMHAAELGFDGVEILHRQMESEDVSYMNKLKQLAFAAGLSLPMLSIHQDFVDPD
jgi:hypothetical protein